MIYNLGPGAEAEYVSKAVSATDAEVAAAMAAARDFPATPLPRFRTELKRRQGFYTDLDTKLYTFGAQRVAKADTLEDAPAAIRRCYEDAVARATAAGEPRPNVAHVNYYSDGTVGIGGHQDTETVDGSSIYSYTLLDGPARTFVVAGTATLAKPTLKVELDHCSMLRMGGPSFQRTWYHGLTPTRGAKFKTAKRLNITIRAWDPAAAVAKG